jgi:bacillopeptidase F
MDLPLTIEVTDNICLNTVKLKYVNKDGEEQAMEAERTSGNYQEGIYKLQSLVSNSPGIPIV